MRDLYPLRLSHVVICFVSCRKTFPRGFVTGRLTTCAGLRHFSSSAVEKLGLQGVFATWPDLVSAIRSKDVSFI
jgi:hypothetical protein